MSDSPLWTPSPEQVDAAELTRFRRAVERQHDVTLADSQQLHAWSVGNPGDFWGQAWAEYIVGDAGSGPYHLPDEFMPNERFFPNARINYAENLLSGADRCSGGENAVAVSFVREDDVRRSLTWRELRQQAAAVAGFLREAGVGPGDRVAAWLPNSPEAVVSMLATSMIGAVFTSTSPDFGVAGVLDRFGQVEPKVLIASDGYVYAGKQQPRLPRLREVVAGLPSLVLS